MLEKRKTAADFRLRNNKWRWLYDKFFIPACKKSRVELWKTAAIIADRCFIYSLFVCLWAFVNACFAFHFKEWCVISLFIKMILQGFLHLQNKQTWWTGGLLKNWDYLSFFSFFFRLTTQSQQKPCTAKKTVSECSCHSICILDPPCCIQTFNSSTRCIQGKVAPFQALCSVRRWPRVLSHQQEPSSCCRRCHSLGRGGGGGGTVGSSGASGQPPPYGRRCSPAVSYSTMF